MPKKAYSLLLYAIRAITPRMYGVCREATHYYESARWLYKVYIQTTWQERLEQSPFECAKIVALTLQTVQKTTHSVMNATWNSNNNQGDDAVTVVPTFVTDQRTIHSVCNATDMDERGDGVKAAVPTSLIVQRIIPSVCNVTEMGK